MSIEKPGLRILGIGDPHFCDSTKFETDILVRDTIAYAQQLQPDLIVCFGDLLDQFEKSKVYAHVEAEEFILQLARIQKTVLLMGNHDRPSNDNFCTKYHFFTGLKSCPNVHVVDAGLVLEVKGYKIACIPYVPPGRFFEVFALMKCQPDQVHLVLAHQEIRGCKYGAVCSENGDVWPENFPPLVSGHIHERQVLKNVYFIGTPYQKAFNEDLEKGLAMIMLNDNKFAIEYLATTIPQKKQLTLTVQEAYTHQLEQNCRLKIFVTGSQAEIDTFILTPQYKYLKSGAKIVLERAVVSKPLELRERRSCLQVIQSKLNERQQQLLKKIL